MKPGWKTTEFWKSLATQVVGVLVIMSVVGSEDSDTLIASVKLVVEGVFAAVAIVLPLLGYMKSRTLVKSAEAKIALTPRAESE